MNPRFLSTVLTFLILSARAGAVEWVSASLNGVDLGKAPSIYDDTTGELIIRLAAAEERQVIDIRWGLLANELAAPLGESFQPTSVSWEAPFLDITITLEPAEIKARQLRLLEIGLAAHKIALLVPVVVYPAKERERGLAELNRQPIYVQRDLEPVLAMLDQWSIRFNVVDTGRALQATGPGLYFISSNVALPPTDGASVFRFHRLTATLPFLEIKGNTADYYYFASPVIAGNADLEMRILNTAQQISTPPSTIVPTRHEEPLF